jgi:hypothetical protein
MKHASTLTALVAAGSFAVAVTACGGSAKPSAPVAPAGPPNIVDVAQQQGCTNLDGIQFGTELYTHVTGTCDFQGQQAELAIFANPTLQNNWTKVASQFGVVLKSGHDWAIVGS